MLGQKALNTAIEWPYSAQGPVAMRFPYCLALEGETLAVADTANNRILFWNHLPVTNAGHPADSITGQPDFLGNGEESMEGRAA